MSNTPELNKLKRVGAGMANSMYNLAHNEALPADMRQSLKDQQREWDAAIAALQSAADTPPSPYAHMVGLVDRLAASLAAFTKHYDPQWMEPPDWATTDDSDCSTFSKHTFGELRKASKLVEEARAVLAGEDVK